MLDKLFGKKKPELSASLLSDLDKYIKAYYIPEEESAVESSVSVEDQLMADGLLQDLQAPKQSASAEAEPFAPQSPEADSIVLEEKKVGYEALEDSDGSEQVSEDALEFHKEEDFSDTIVMDGETYYNTMMELGVQLPRPTATMSSADMAGTGVAGSGLAGAGLEAVLARTGETFSQSLIRLIDAKGFLDADVYKRADVDRRLFSKIRNNDDYRPRKQTALSLALALELNLDEAIDFLSRAGYAFSPSSVSDLIVRYCIEHNLYDLNDVNALLFEYDQPVLGGRLA